MGNWVSILVGVTALLAFLGTGATFVFRGKQDARIKNLEKSNGDLRNDVDDRDKRIVFLEAENSTKGVEIEALKSQVIALEKLKIGEAYFQAIEAQIEARSEHIDAGLASNAAVLDLIRKQNRDILAMLADQRRQL